MKVIKRLCLASREIKDRSELIRIVRTPQGVIMIDTKGNLPGRGCYISRDANCIAIARKKNLLARALRASVEDEIYEQLLKEI